jgi:hypothetical protein
MADEASPLALRSTRNSSEESSAPRRGLAGRATEQLTGRAGGSLALAGGPPPSRHGCQAPQTLSTGTRWGGPARARWAWWPRRCGCRPCLRQRVGVLGQRPESSVWCGCPASRVPVHAAAVRCPVRASERPDVRCLVSSVGVRCPWVPASPVSGREVVEGGGGQAAAWLGWPASAWSPALSTASSSAAGSEPAVEAGAGLLGQRRGRFGLGRRRRRWLGQWLGRPRGRPGLAGWARGSPVGGEPGCAARRRLRCVVIV